MTPQTPDDREFLSRFLPVGWEDEALGLGVCSAGVKLTWQKSCRGGMIHLTSGMSLRTTVAYTHEAGLCGINDAALLHRLGVSEEWLHWMCLEILKGMKACSASRDPGAVFKPGWWTESPSAHREARELIGWSTAVWGRTICDVIPFGSPARKQGRAFSASMSRQVIFYGKRRNTIHVFKNRRTCPCAIPWYQSASFYEEREILFTVGAPSLKAGDCGDWGVYFPQKAEREQR